MSAESRNIGGHKPPLQQESKSIQLLVSCNGFYSSGRFERAEFFKKTI
jgi:hypothetical protein